MCSGSPYLIAWIRNLYLKCEKWERHVASEMIIYFLSASCLRPTETSEGIALFDILIKFGYIGKAFSKYL